MTTPTKPDAEGTIYRKAMNHLGIQPDIDLDELGFNERAAVEAWCAGWHIAKSEEVSPREKAQFEALKEWAKKARYDIISASHTNLGRYGPYDVKIELARLDNLVHELDAILAEGEERR